MKKRLLLAALLCVVALNGPALAASTTVGGNISWGQGDSTAYTLSISQMYEPWISADVCELAPLAEIGGHVWNPDESDKDAVWGGYIAVGLRFSLITNKPIKPFIEGSFGGVVNSDDTMGTRDLGSHALFRSRGSVGVNFGEAYNHKIQGDVIHFSTAGLTNNNDGYTTYGVAYGYSF